MRESQLVYNYRMKNFYAEILHPYEDKVLWHYFLAARDKDAAQKAVTDQVIAEHSNGFLLDTGGLFLVTIEEDADRNITP